MVSTVASRDMKKSVGTKDITMMHSVADILGVNSIIGDILDRQQGLLSGWFRIVGNRHRRKSVLPLACSGLLPKPLRP